MNNSYVLTEIGQKQCETYIAELKAKRKELLDAGIDTANNTYIDFTPIIRRYARRFVYRR